MYPDETQIITPESESRGRLYFQGIIGERERKSSFIGIDFSVYARVASRVNRIGLIPLLRFRSTNIRYVTYIVRRIISALSLR